jgi:hypothetical protein
LALFAGSSVDGWSDQALARLIVRRDEGTADQLLPVVSGPHALSPGDDDDCLAGILALPPAIPASDEGVAHALTTISLVHLWTSSRAALVASVRKRLARAIALRDAVAAGHMPTASELAVWAYADGALQLAFPLFPPGAPVIDPDTLNTQLDRFVDAAEHLLDRCRLRPDPDEERVRLLRMLREQHSGKRVVAFSQYAHTIMALGRIMRADRGVAVVTAHGARIASGPLSREEVLEQFMAASPRVHPAEHIGVLLTTDLLSEGIDLRGAAVIVHLDLPWNPGRMEQRVGRSRRLGSPHETIHVYTFVPPTAAERLIELRRRLSEKVAVARATIGGGFNPVGLPESAASPVGSGEELRRQMRGWLVEEADDPGQIESVAAALWSGDGWIAAVVVGGVPRLIGNLGAGIIDDALALGQVICQIEAPASVRALRHAEVLESIREWLSARDASAGTERQSIAKRAVLDRLTQTITRAPRHRRSAMIATAQRTRHALAGAAGIGIERVLATLARSTADDEAWLQSVDAFSRLHSDNATGPRLSDGIVAIILLVPVSAAADATPG